MNYVYESNHYQITLHVSGTHELCLLKTTQQEEYNAKKIISCPGIQKQKKKQQNQQKMPKKLAKQKQIIFL